MDKKKNSKRLLIFGMTSLMLMTGCKKSKVVEINGEKNLQNESEYASIIMEPKVFEPGTHFITHQSKIYYKLTKGWNVANINCPDIPEGYKYVNSTILDRDMHGNAFYILHIYVNKVPVEVVPTYNEKTGEIEYNSIGKPVKRLILE